MGAEQGRVYYEITVADEGLCRDGWSARQASLDLGTEPISFGLWRHRCVICAGSGVQQHIRELSCQRPTSAETVCAPVQDIEHQLTAALTALLPLQARSQTTGSLAPMVLLMARMHYRLPVRLGPQHDLLHQEWRRPRGSIPDLRAGAGKSPVPSHLPEDR